MIGLSGFAGAGKDAICAAMPQFKRTAFADALKSDLHPLLERLGLDLNFPEDKAVSRELMVAYGRLARKVMPDYWLGRVVIPKGDVCICDVRYLNEAKFVISRGGVVFRITRPGIYAANPEEEKSLADLDAAIDMPRIHNDGTVEAAARQVLDFLANR